MRGSVRNVQQTSENKFKNNCHTSITRSSIVVSFFVDVHIIPALIFLQNLCPVMYIVAADGGCERDVVDKLNYGKTEKGTLKIVMNNRGLWINAKKCLCKGVIVATALYEAEACGMRSAN